MYRILIVEDDPIISEAVNRFLSKWGYTVETVTDFNNVLEHFTRYMPQLVLMDIGLPFYNGYFWCSEIRKVSQVPIIFISSASDNMNIVMAMNMGGDDLLLKRYDIYEIVKRAVKKYSVLFIGSGLSFSMEEFTCMAVTDEKWLSFVIEQILSNALKYTKEGTIRIAALQEKAGSLIVIEDTGIGISESDLPRIYERGFTGYNGRMDKKSTGIGLYLCKEICRRLSHTIQVESELGKGTRVIIGFCQEKDD